MNTFDREQEWADGHHTSSTGTRMPLSDIPTPHLRNIITKYSLDHNVSALDAELLQRQADEE